MNHLIAISVGPVQEFIVAARRTRDLWLGSYLLSEISRAVAVEVEEQGGNLIFPASVAAENVANVILAQLETANPVTVASNAKKAAQERWLTFVKDTYDQASGVIRKEIWDEQCNDVIEFYAAWIEHNNPQQYTSDRAKLMRLLAGRKNFRDFTAAKGHVGIPKSSLDGQRESVLKDPAKEPWPERFRAQLRVREGEQLDVVGLVKRVAEGKRAYPSVSRLAADPWVRGNQYRLNDVIHECQALGNSIIRRLDTNTDTGHPHFQNFPYEGTALYVSRHHELIEETGCTQEELHGLRAALSSLPEPSPYLAILVADGDRMGAAIRNLDTIAANQKFSRDLADFSSKAQNIVDQHQGVLVYAGGDDVLAFLPVDKCLACARSLHDCFGELLKEYGEPTLTVGIAIGHFMENLEDLLEYGRAAEKAAKKIDETTTGSENRSGNPALEKDALAVHLHKRGGAPIRIQNKWNDAPNVRLTRYAQWIRCEAIPSKLPYDLRKLHDVYRGWPSQILSEALPLDVLRLIRDKQPRRGRKYLEEIEREIIPLLTDLKQLNRFIEELLIAHQIAVALGQARVPNEVVLETTL